MIPEKTFRLTMAGGVLFVMALLLLGSLVGGCRPPERASASEAPVLRGLTARLAGDSVLLDGYTRNSPVGTGFSQPDSFRLSAARVPPGTPATSRMVRAGAGTFTLVLVGIQPEETWSGRYCLRGKKGNTFAADSVCLNWGPLTRPALPVGNPILDSVKARLLIGTLPVGPADSVLGTIVLPRLWDSARHTALQSADEALWFNSAPPGFNPATNKYASILCGAAILGDGKVGIYSQADPACKTIYANRVPADMRALTPVQQAVVDAKIECFEFVVFDVVEIPDSTGHIWPNHYYSTADCTTITVEPEA